MASRCGGRCRNCCRTRSGPSTSAAEAAPARHFPAGRMRETMRPSAKLPHQSARRAARRGTMNLRAVEKPHAAAPAPAPAAHPDRNPGFPLDLGWVDAIRMNRSALERRAATIGTRRTVKKDWQAAWLLRAITLMDLTSL